MVHINSINVTDNRILRSPKYQAQASGVVATAILNSRLDSNVPRGMVQLDQRFVQVYVFTFFFLLMLGV